jgi:hypothetical protein
LDQETAEPGEFSSDRLSVIMYSNITTDVYCYVCETDYCNPEEIFDIKIPMMPELELAIDFAIANETDHKVEHMCPTCMDNGCRKTGSIVESFANFIIFIVNRFVDEKVLEDKMVFHKSLDLSKHCEKSKFKLLLSVVASKGLYSAYRFKTYAKRRHTWYSFDKNV